ncbi:unnamed protein product, partial [Cyprideis torosa]
MADRANSKLATKDKLKQKEVDDPFEERKKPASEKKPANGYQADEKCARAYKGKVISSEENDNIETLQG